VSLFLLHYTRPGREVTTLFRIERRRDLTPVTKLFVVSAPLVARKAQPGQFVIVRVTENGERIPLTIADADAKAGTVTIVIQEVGMTSRLMGALKEGESILGFVGPLGLPCPLTDRGPVVLVGGGFGVAPIYPIAKALKARGVRVISIIGARTRDLLILEPEMAGVSDELLVATDDGSQGHHGFVTDVLRQLIETGREIEHVIAIGPMVMMRAVAKTTEPFKVKTLVSVDPIMVDGTGMCGACRLTVGGEVKFACVDGPIFDAQLVNWEEAVRRGKMYSVEQKLAVEKLDREQASGNCACGCGGGH
jgi:ferredoxin--NADP+ reductase